MQDLLSAQQLAANRRCRWAGTMELRPALLTRLRLYAEATVRKRQGFYVHEKAFQIELCKEVCGTGALRTDFET